MPKNAIVPTIRAISSNADTHILNNHFKIHNSSTETTNSI